ncbi:21305_t:CDS:2 [Dentiscutata erythropus]|uniref:21305_t:CDS:1 n=1 Tax=Dentiscutata erythropus TaxID=1348616 RepID=A0A9N9AVD2_9GLOM|nr:21305_t:CDS:2 [Dentiscutata erythropus]
MINSFNLFNIFSQHCPRCTSNTGSTFPNGDCWLQDSQSSLGVLKCLRKPLKKALATEHSATLHISSYR